MHPQILKTKIVSLVQDVTLRHKKDVTMQQVIVLLHGTLLFLFSVQKYN